MPDYFLKVGKPYLGDMFADHDFMEDLWEDQYDPDFVSRFKFDAWADPDNDGWSNFAECRAATDPTRAARLGVDEMLQLEYPLPTIKATIHYNGDMPFGSMVIQAWHANDAFGRPDAVWSIAASKADDGNNSSSSSGTNAVPGSARLIGVNPGKEVVLTLGPGAVVPGTVQLVFKDIAFEAISATRTTYVDIDGTASVSEVVRSRTLGDAASATWVLISRDRVRSGDHSKGDLVITTLSSIEEVIGTIDYYTGDVSIDFSKLRFDAEYDLAQRGYSGSISEWSYKLCHLANAYAKLQWTSRLPQQSFPVTFALSDPAVPTEVNSLGRLREGKNLFVAFLDLNNDGVWTPGEPYGATPDVDVGWSGNSVAIELTDTSSSMMRINLRDAVAASGFEAVTAFTDRGIHGNGAVPNVSVPEGTNMPAQTYNSVRVRIAAQAINGRTQYTSGSSARYLNSVPFDERINLAANGILSEKDLFAAGDFDLDWGTLSGQATRMGFADLSVVTQVVYRVVIGDGDISSANTNNSLAVAFVNQFEVERASTTAVSPKGNIFGQPTFAWRHDNSIGKAYPAFRLRVWNSTSALVYDSGIRQAPVRNADGVYSWTAPIYPDMMTPNGKVFATTNNYTWAVSMLDAKFSEPGSETRQAFRLEASGQLGNISDYGMIKAKVHYFGPGTAATGNVKNLIRVQAFTSPDFTGMPAGEAMVKDVSRLSDVGDIDVNAVILGIKPGTYYIRAFIDSDGDAEWAQWESLGYGNYVGAVDAALVRITRGSVASFAAAATYPFTPRPYTVAVGEVPPTAEIYIEDMDSDNDHLPDIWEWNQKSSLDTLGPPSGATFFTKVNTNLATTVKSYTMLNASSSGQTYAPITLMNSIISGSDPAAMAAAIDFFTDSSADTDSVAVRIDSFSLADGLALSITSDVQVSDAGDLTVFVTTDSANVKVVLMASDSPDFANAKETVVKSITIRANVETKEVVSADELREAIDTAGLGNSAFFKVKLEQ